MGELITGRVILCRCQIRRFPAIQHAGLLDYFRILALRVAESERNTDGLSQPAALPPNRKPITFLHEFKSPTCASSHPRWLGQKPSPGTG
jgi:hypothetical protein